MKSIIVGVVAGACWFGSAPVAQDPERRWTPDQDVQSNVVLAGSVNLQEDSATQQLRGSGPNYEVSFGANRIAFFPSLGIVTEQTHSLELSLDSIARRTGTPRPVGVAARRVESLRVRYERPTFDEVYDVRADGVEQSFVFRALPEGAGDLVVRVKVDTDLQPRRVGDGMEFRLPGAGAATVGGVTGIDARGERVAGSMRYEDGVLELALPGAFVESAALPLVLDPLIGSTVAISGSGWDQGIPDVAYDTTNDVYLVVFEREVGSTLQIRGQRVGPNGVLVGSTVFIETTTTSKRTPVVANVNVRDAFVVCWTENNNIRARGVLADGTVGPASIAVGATPAIELAPDIGGEATNTDDEAVVVWSNLTTLNVEARQITIGRNAQLLLPGLTTLISQGGWRDTAPCIAKSGGPTGRFLVCWQRDFTSRVDLRGAIIDRNLGMIDSTVTITSASLRDEDPACDGDGTRWVVAWEHQESSGSIRDDIYCASVSLEGSNAVVSSPRAVEAQPNDDERNAAVGWTGHSAIICWADEVRAPDYDALFATVDPFGCSICERKASLEFGSRDSDLLAIATQQSGGANEFLEDALIAWDSRNVSTSDSVVLGQFVRAEDGIVINVGGGCGQGGTAHATCVVVDNTLFEHRLRGARPNATAGLLLGFERINSTCSAGCRLVPNPFLGYVFPVSTDSRGNASVAMPLPSDPSVAGLLFYDQWLVVSPTAGCAVLGTDFSNALGIRIQ